ncbi:YihY/virulence factor BrkB family protein [Roseibium aestuarii]|uniref:YihY/virulence factor BrkB family protein n=1 Tax=Roseibium aestuarii TaxID=2600299 RepID=A0ABW4JU04_9HYPH|nr:YihY/virulence factor BrkB family protein [Roseibium aestuarii]
MANSTSDTLARDANRPRIGTAAPTPERGSGDDVATADWRGQRGRGRRARSITQIPSRGWLDILLRVRDKLQDDNIGLIAAGSTFFIILSLVPALGALVSLYGLLTDPMTLGDQLDRFELYVPAGAMEIIRGELTRLVTRTDQTLGVSFVISLVAALWSANKGVAALFQAMNVAYKEAETRNFLVVKGLTLAFTLSILIFGLIVLNSAVTLPLVFGALGLDGLYALIAGISVPLLLLGGSVFGIGALYRWGPSRRGAKWRWITPGALFAAVAMIAVAAGFAFYLSRFGDYGATYGSLGAVIGLMMWIYLSTYVVLLGAELNAEIEHQTALDSTIGPDRPMGERDATVADTVGETRSLGLRKAYLKVRSLLAPTGLVPGDGR